MTRELLRRARVVPVAQAISEMIESWLPTLKAGRHGATTAIEAPVKIIVREANNVTVLDLIGPLVWEQPVEAFREQIRHLLAAGTKSLAINLAQVPNVDSTALGALFAAHKSVQEAEAKCKFFAATEEVIRSLKRMLLDKVFELFEVEASAVSSFGWGTQ